MQTKWFLKKNYQWKGECDFFCSLYFNYVCVIMPFPFRQINNDINIFFAFKKGFNPIMTCFTYMQQCWDICFCLGSRDVGNPVPCIRPSKNLHVFLHILCWIQHPVKEIKMFYFLTQSTWIVLCLNTDNSEK